MVFLWPCTDLEQEVIFGAVVFELYPLIELCGLLGGGGSTRAES